MSDSWLLIDKALVFWEDMALTETWDFQTVSWFDIVLQAAQNRLVSWTETWTFDDGFGSQLGKQLQNMPSSKVTDSIAGNFVNAALQPMILDGRIKSVDSIKIISRDSDSITIEVIMTLWGFSGSVTVSLPTFSI